MASVVQHCINNRHAFDLYSNLDLYSNHHNNYYDNNYWYHKLLRNGHLDVVSYLLKNEKFNVNAKDEEGRTALHFACG